MASKQALSVADQSRDVTVDRLDAVFDRLAKLLSTLHADCLNLQDLQSRNEAELDAAHIVQAQALDRVTQNLDCLSAFSATLAELADVQNVELRRTVFDDIPLETVRRALSTDTGADELDTAEDIDLFDD